MKKDLNNWQYKLPFTLHSLFSLIVIPIFFCSCDNLSPSSSLLFLQWSTGRYLLWPTLISHPDYLHQLWSCWKHVCIYTHIEAPRQKDKKNWEHFLRMKPNHEEYFCIVGPLGLDLVPSACRSKITGLFFITDKSLNWAEPPQHIVATIKSSCPKQICKHWGVKVRFIVTQFTTHVAHSFNAWPLSSWSVPVSIDKYCMDSLWDTEMFPY